MSIHKEIAEYLYDLLVVNPYAAAIQMDDGNYITKYFDFSPFVIEEMLMQHGSMGCYQQGYKTNKIKWICSTPASELLIPLGNLSISCPV